MFQSQHAAAVNLTLVEKINPRSGLDINGIEANEQEYEGKICTSNPNHQDPFPHPVPGMELHQFHCILQILTARLNQFHLLESQLHPC